MRNLFHLSCLLLLWLAPAGPARVWAQNVPVSGTVLSATDRQPIIGATVLLKGTTTGATTDPQGRFTINAPGSGTLVVSSVGFTSQEVAINNQSQLSIVLQEDIKALEEVVVTALGIKREARKLGYATATVNTEQLTTTRTTNVGNSLVGKVAGLNVSAPPSGPGGSSKIRIRGQSSFGGNNAPLIIVNGVPINNTPAGLANGATVGFAGEARTDTGDGLQSINPDDIESMTVLKGAAASALYGFRAKDGAIIITTKSGRGQAGIGVELTSNFQADHALDFTDFQYEYGQGENGLRPQSLAAARGGTGSGVFSFGERFDGQPTWSHNGTLEPYQPHKNRVDDFYRTGTTYTNSVALSGGTDKGNFRLSFANTDANSIVPKADFHKKILNFGLNYNLTEKLSAQLNANYSNEYNRNPPVVVQQDYNINQTLMTLANSIDVRWLEANYVDPVTGNEIFPARFTNRSNPYWTINKRLEESRRDRIFGNASVRYQLLPGLYAQGRVGQDYFTNPYNANRPTGTGFLAGAPTGFNGNFYQSVSTFRERNLDLLVGANRSFGKVGVELTLGGNSMDQKSDRLGTSVTNFYVRDLYTIGNGQVKEPNYAFSHKRVNSLYGTLDLSYGDYLFLNLTGRNDWFSTLNPNSNSYLYPSASASFVFSQAMSALPAWLSYGKLRAAYAEVGGDTDPYTNALFYSINANPLGSTALGNISGTVSPNPNLRPLKVKEAEVGLELRTFDNRLSLDAAFYRKNTVDEILNVDISAASGFNQTKVNVGKLRNQGLEMLLSLVPVRSETGETINWESAFNFTINNSEVLQLAQGQQRFDTGTGEFIGIVSHEVGQPLASLRGFDYRRDDQGRVVTSAGRFLQGNLRTFGSAVPTHTGGWLNTLTWKGLRLFTQVDFKAGHKLISNSNFNWYRHGLHKASLVGRQGGVVMDAANADGTPNTTAVAAQDFYTLYRGTSVTTPFVYNASFVRWRTLSLGYDFSKVLGLDFVKGLSVNAFVNNVLMIKKYVDNLDPETQYSASDNLNGLEAHALPTTRSYGLNINIKL